MVTPQLPIVPKMELVMVEQQWLNPMECNTIIIRIDSILNNSILEFLATGV